MSFTAPRKRTARASDAGGARAVRSALVQPIALAAREQHDARLSASAAPGERTHRRQQTELVLLEADAAGKQQRARCPGVELPARARLGALRVRRRAEIVDVEQVVDDAHLVRAHARPAHELVLHADRVGEDDAAAPLTEPLGRQVAQPHHAVAAAGDGDRDTRPLCRQPRPEVRLVAVRVHNVGLLAAQDVGQAIERAQVHSPHPSSCAGWPGGQRPSKKISSAWYTHSTGSKRAGSWLMSYRICPSGPPCWRLGMK